MEIFGELLEDLIGDSDDAGLEVPLNVYCQSCGKDITFEGGDVSSSKKIYCHGDKENVSRCANVDISRGIEKQKEMMKWMII